MSLAPNHWENSSALKPDWSIIDTSYTIIDAYTYLWKEHIHVYMYV